MKLKGDPKMEKENIKCKKCGSGQTYIRIKEKSIVCRHCGHVELLENKE